MAPRTKVIDSSTPQSSPSKISSTKVMKKERSRKTKTSTPVHVRSPKKLPPSEKTDDESTWDEDEFEVEEIRASKVDLVSDIVPGSVFFFEVFMLQKHKKQSKVISSRILVLLVDEFWKYETMTQVDAANHFQVWELKT
eukprot:TRINITY_DN186_c0_g1_i1.p1 TRINITY_DN186_c0_g1~~TRINITY_DN186_c0_g1_i1.p1  ORF type:complete len:139 (-),score=34.84 TRINITY_DN186_c0_g1_i1:706-1122(-)